MKFYVIRETTEYSAHIRYIATTREECERHIMEFADFYSNRGTCTIYEVDEKLQVSRSFSYDEGRLVYTKGWNKVIYLD